MNTTERICEAFICGKSWLIVYSGEGLLIILGNSVTAFIFLKIRRTLKRTSYLLINLTVADLFVGIAIFLYIWDSIAVMEGKNGSENVWISGLIIDFLASTASLLSLSLISLERMFAILWPFRHRLLETCYYFAFIGGVWLLATANTVYVIRSYLADGGAYGTAPMSIIVIVSILITTASYLVIWMSVKRSQLPNTTSRSLEQNRRLAKTLFLVTIISLITWLPVGINMLSPSHLKDADFYIHMTLALQYTNSLLNPVVYCFKMPEFKQALKYIFCRCRSRKSDRDDISLQVSQGISLTSFKSVG